MLGKTLNFILSQEQNVASNGKIPVYVRVTTDGLQENLSLGFKVLLKDWNPETKTVRSGDTRHKALNKKIGQTKADLERHFDLMQAKNEIATPALVSKLYKTPLRGARIRQQKIDTLAMSEEIGTCINDFLAFNEKHHATHKDGCQPVHVRQQYLDQKRQKIFS